MGDVSLLPCFFLVMLWECLLTAFRLSWCSEGTEVWKPFLDSYFQRRSFREEDLEEVVQQSCDE